MLSKIIKKIKLAYHKYFGPKVIVVCGPTASGKTDLSLKLAKEFNGEIISADSKQLYRNLSLGNGKVTEKEMGNIKHYMLDVINPGEILTVLEYSKIATSILEDIIRRGKTAIIAGGTGQYIDALVFGQQYPNIPPDEEFRNDCNNTPLETLVDLLVKEDPELAEQIDLKNKVRVIRALEIAKSGKTRPDINDRPIYRTKFYILNPSKEKLHEKIRLRIAKRMKDGMLEEAKYVSTLNLNDTQIKQLGIEYESMDLYLKDKLSYDDMLLFMETKTRHYAKRQITWCKKYKKYRHKIIS